MTQSAGYDSTLVSQLADVSLVSVTLELPQVSRPQDVSQKRLVFTNDGVAVGVVIRNVELMI